MTHTSTKASAKCDLTNAVAVVAAVDAVDASASADVALLSVVLTIGAAHVMHGAHVAVTVAVPSSSETTRPRRRMPSAAYCMFVSMEAKTRR